MPDSQLTTVDNTLVDDRPPESIGPSPNSDPDVLDQAPGQDPPELDDLGNGGNVPNDPTLHDQAPQSDDLTLNRGTAISKVNPKIAAAVSKALEGTLVDSRVTEWRSRIAMVWNKTLRDIVAIGLILKEAKEDLGASYKELVVELPFSASMARNFVIIAEHKVLSDPQYLERLPNAVSTLSYLARVKKEKLVTYIENGEVTPALLLDKAKELAQAKTGTRSKGKPGKYMDVVMSLPRSADVSGAVKAAQDLAKTYDGRFDYRKNEAAIGAVLLASVHQLALNQIEGTKGTLTNVTLDQMRMLDGATESLLKSKKEDKGSEPQLPDDYPEFEALTTLLGEPEITLPVMMEWCEEKGVPSRLALKDVDQPVFVWELARQIAEKPDDEDARERLEQVAKAKNRTIARLALDILDMLDNMPNGEAQNTP